MGSLGFKNFFSDAKSINCTCLPLREQISLPMTKQAQCSKIVMSACIMKVPVISRPVGYIILAV